MSGTSLLVVELIKSSTKASVLGTQLNDGPPPGYLFKASRPNVTADGFIVDDDTAIDDDTVLTAYQLPSTGGKNYAGLVGLLDDTIWYTSGTPHRLQLSMITSDSLTNTSTVIAGSGGKVVIYPAGTDTTKINNAKKWAGVPVS